MASDSSGRARSYSSPLTLAATASWASLGLMDFATSMGRLPGESVCRLPSGRVIVMLLIEIDPSAYHRRRAGPAGGGSGRCLATAPELAENALRVIQRKPSSEGGTRCSIKTAANFWARQLALPRLRSFRDMCWEVRALSRPATRSLWPTIGVGTQGLRELPALLSDPRNPDRRRLRPLQGCRRLPRLVHHRHSQLHSQDARKARLEGRQRRQHPRRPRRRQGHRRDLLRVSGRHKGCSAYADYRELLEKEKDLNAVKIMTPDHLHGGHQHCGHEAGQTRHGAQAASPTG